MSESPQGSGRAFIGDASVASAPEVAERVGAALADRLRGEAVDVVLCWGEPDDAVLAHVVARELGVRTVRVHLVEGLMGTSGRMEKGERAVMVGETFHGLNSISAPSGLASVHGARVVAVAAAVPSPELAAARAACGVLVVTADAVEE